MNTTFITVMSSISGILVGIIFLFILFGKIDKFRNRRSNMEDKYIVGVMITVMISILVFLTGWYATGNSSWKNVANIIEPQEVVKGQYTVYAKVNSNVVISTDSYICSLPTNKIVVFQVLCLDNYGNPISTSYSLIERK